MPVTNEQAAATLAPFVKDYENKLNNAEFESLMAFYHPNAVLIETGKSCLWGPKDIGESLAQMSTEFGKTTMTLSKQKYSGTGEYLILDSDFCFHTEKAGDMFGHYTQIWKEYNGKYVIYHDEYSLN